MSVVESIVDAGKTFGLWIFGILLMIFGGLAWVDGSTFGGVIILIGFVIFGASYIHAEKAKQK